MIARRVPATPLPWRHANGYVNASDGMTVADADENAAYIAHACNAYPRLVEAIKEWLPTDACDYGTQDAAMAALLRELGESE